MLYTALLKPMGRERKFVIHSVIVTKGITKQIDNFQEVLGIIYTNNYIINIIIFSQYKI